MKSDIYEKNCSNVSYAEHNNDKLHNPDVFGKPVTCEIQQNILNLRSILKNDKRSRN